MYPTLLALLYTHPSIAERTFITINPSAPIGPMDGVAEETHETLFVRRIEIHEVTRGRPQGSAFEQASELERRMVQEN